MHRRPKELGVVIASYNLFGDPVCVDFFQRTNGTFGYEQYRREVEDQKGWFPIGHTGGKLFDSLANAKADALAQIAWLADEMKDERTDGI